MLSGSRIIPSIRPSNKHGNGQPPASSSEHGLQVRGHAIHLTMRTLGRSCDITRHGLRTNRVFRPIASRVLPRTLDGCSRPAWSPSVPPPRSGCIGCASIVGTGTKTVVGKAEVVLPEVEQVTTPAFLGFAMIA